MSATSSGFSFNADLSPSLASLKGLDDILRCPICFDYMQAVMLLPKCQHNFCSLCIRRFFTNKSICPVCSCPATSNDLTNNRIMDLTIEQYKEIRQSLQELTEVKSQQNVSPVSPSSLFSDDGALIETRDVSPSSSSGHLISTHSCTSQPSLPDKQLLKNSYTPDKKQSAQAKSSDTAVLASDSSVNDSDVEIITDEDVADFPKDTNGATLKTKQVFPVFTSAGSPRLQKTVQTKLLSLLPKMTPGLDIVPAVCAKSEPHLWQEAEDCNAVQSMKQKSSRSSIFESQSSRSSMTKPQSSMSSVSKEKLVSHLQPPSFDQQEQSSYTADSSEKVLCPVCAIPVLPHGINQHLDLCLTSEDKKSSLRKTEKKKPLPKLVYNLLSEKDIRKRLKELGLSTQGDKHTLIKRHQEFTLYYNADCDALRQKEMSQLVKEFEEMQQLQKQSSRQSSDAQSTLPYAKGLKIEDIEKANKKYACRNRKQFQTLIAEARNTMQASKAPVTASEGSVTTSEMSLATTEVSLAAPERSLATSEGSEAASKVSMTTSKVAVAASKRSMMFPKGSLITSEGSVTPSKVSVAASEDSMTAREEGSVAASGRSPTMAASGRSPTVAVSGRSLTVAASRRSQTVAASGRPPTVAASGRSLTVTSSKEFSNTLGLEVRPDKDNCVNFSSMKTKFLSDESDTAQTLSVCNESCSSSFPDSLDVTLNLKTHAGKSKPEEPHFKVAELNSIIAESHTVISKPNVKMTEGKLDDNSECELLESTHEKEEGLKDSFNLTLPDSEMGEVRDFAKDPNHKETEEHEKSCYFPVKEQINKKKWKKRKQLSSYEIGTNCQNSDRDVENTAVSESDATDLPAKLLDLLQKSTQCSVLQQHVSDAKDQTLLGEPKTPLKDKKRRNAAPEEDLPTLSKASRKKKSRRERENEILLT